jgi:hypothetical protein
MAGRGEGHGPKRATVASLIKVVRANSRAQSPEERKARFEPTTLPLIQICTTRLFVPGATVRSPACVSGAEHLRQIYLSGVAPNLISHTVSPVGLKLKLNATFLPRQAVAHLGEGRLRFQVALALPQRIARTKTAGERKMMQIATKYRIAIRGI